VGKERREWKGRNRECKDVELAAKALVVSEPMAIFHAGHYLSELRREFDWSGCSFGPSAS